MKINSPAEDRIIVDLSEQDMSELDITYEAMDYSTIETRRVIWTVLDEAGKILGKDLDPSRRMIIEAIPKSQGGCTLCFTLLDAKRKPLSQKHILKKQDECLICDFENLDDLFNAAEELERLDVQGQSSLFESTGVYRLILSGSADTLKGSLSEFCKIRNGNALACEFTKEHWKTLASGDAIKTILRH